MSGSPSEGSPSARALLARYLRQRGELGTEGLHLVELAPREVLSRAGPGGGADRGWGGLARGEVGVPPGEGVGRATEARGQTHESMVPPGVQAPSFRGSGQGERPAPPAAGAGAMASVGGTGMAEDFETLDALHVACAGCTRCGLARTRTQVVVADGNPKAQVMVVGEAPGAHEDQQGRPFVGAAGKLLDLLLKCVDLSRKEDVFICNVIKCRPPGNRNPTVEEVRACSPWLRRQIELVSPRAILAVGTFAGQLLSGSDAPLGRLRGEVRNHEGIPLVVTYHPAALLRNSGWILPTWEDLQQLRKLLDATSHP